MKSYVTRAINNHHWGKALVVILIAAGIAVLALYLLSQWLQVGAIEWLVFVFGFTAIMDLFLAWANERSIKNGTVKLWNELAGEMVEVIAAFKDQGKHYKGKVRLGMETWDATSETPLTQGMRVKIVDREGLVLHVEPSS